MIQTFPRDPTSQYGGVAITEGVRVEAVAQYIHFFSTFDQTHYHNPKKYFAYQIRISVDPSASAPFYPARCLVKIIL